MLDKRFSAKDIENECLDIWEKKKTFKFSDKRSKKSFCIMMPPPNITGSLHMGHALTFTLQDILVRYQKKLGKNVLWQPGIDHAGIATEIVVEKKLLDEEKKNKRTLGREKFIKKVWNWKNESGGRIVNQLKRLGAAVDWSISRFTMDEGLSKSVNEVFVKLYSNRLIYKDKRLANWDPKLQTALSDLEVTQKETNGKLWFIKYKVYDEDDFLVVATTRPETMFGDVAIAIHPKNKGLKKFIGKKVLVPFTKRIIPIIADKYANPKKGSGAVKITPAHDFNDFIVGKNHKLDVINIFDSFAKLNKNVPEKYFGIDRFEARNLILNDLHQNKLIEKVEDNSMVIPIGERSGSIIEPYLTDQWFLDAKKLSIAVKRSIKNNELNFFPSSWLNTFNHWINNIEPWCISRQIWWGHRIPVWYTNNNNIIVARNFAEAKKIEKKLPNTKITHQESDVLDTWFSSALWPFSTLGWPQNNPTLRKYYPTDILVTGFDIIFFWVARMVMMGLHFMKKVPFNSVYIHPLVKDEKGDKMSKSKGNVIDPLHLINLYGADALRFTLTNLSTQGQDIKLSDKLVENGRNFITKLWNVARFSQFNKFLSKKNYNPQKNILLINKWINFKFISTQKNVLKHLGKYKFNLIISDLYHFIWSDFCDLYIEFSKFYLKDKKNFSEISSNFSYIFKNILNLINPIIPFVTEKISKDLGYSSESLYHKEFSKTNRNTINKSELLNFESLINLVKEIRFRLKCFEKNKKVSLYILSKKKFFWLDDHYLLLKGIFNFEEISYKDEIDQYKKSIFLVTGIKFTLFSNTEISNDNEIKKNIEFYKNEVKFFEKKLKNKNFVGKAPEKIVNLQKKKLVLAKKNLKLLTKKDV